MSHFLCSFLALDAESEHMVQEAIDHMLAEGRGKDGNPGESKSIVFFHALSFEFDSDSFAFSTAFFRHDSADCGTSLINDPKCRYHICCARWKSRRRGESRRAYQEP